MHKELDDWLDFAWARREDILDAAPCPHKFKGHLHYIEPQHNPGVMMLYGYYRNTEERDDADSHADVFYKQGLLDA